MSIRVRTSVRDPLASFLVSETPSVSANEANALRTNPPAWERWLEGVQGVQTTSAQLVLSPTLPNYLCGYR